jgi:hypothetical protein
MHCRGYPAEALGPGGFAATLWPTVGNIAGIATIFSVLRPFQIGWRSGMTQHVCADGIERAPPEHARRVAPPCTPCTKTTRGRQRFRGCLDALEATQGQI